MAASWVVPPPNEILKKGMAAAGKWGAVGRFMGRPAPQRNLKKGNGGRRGVEFSCPPAEVGGQTGKFAHRREVRKSRIFSPRSATFAAPPLSRRPMWSPRRAVSWSLRRAPCGCRAALWSFRRCRAAPRSLWLSRRFMVAPRLSPSAAVAAGLRAVKFRSGRRPVCPVSFSFS